MSRLNLIVLSLSCGVLIHSPLSALAQIVPDNSLPNNSIVIPNGNINEIQGGTTAGNNLFHSFEQFSVSPNTAAFFNNAVTIENIITRVTGSSISTIEGLIRANGAANLFLLNPNGIIFGPNATLQIGGSFVGSTANSIQFGDGTEFSATNPNNSALLSVNIPIGLQYGASPGDITVQGTGNNLSISPSIGNTVRENRPVGVQVPSGQTLALVGGNILLEGGNLTAESGRIELGSVREGTVRLNSTNPGWSFNYDGIQNFQDIQLSQAASVDTSGNGGGTIHVQGGRVVVADSSAILANTSGNVAGGGLTVKASELVAVTGSSPETPFFSILSTDVDPGATGQGGDIQVETNQLVVAGGAKLVSTTYGVGNAGNLIIQANQVSLSSGGRLPVGSSGLFSSASFGSTGRGGDIQVETVGLQVTGGAQIFTGTLSSGDGGNLSVRATDVELVGTSPSGVSSSGLFSNVVVPEINSGNGGDLTLDTQRLLVTDGARITALTAGSGNAGTLNINATEISVEGFGPQGPSFILATIEPTGTGKGGNLIINTQQLNVQEGAQVAVSTGGTGDAGTLTVVADQINLSGTSETSQSGLFSNALESTGNGGQIDITTNQLTIQNGATINASNFPSLNLDRPPGEGQAGDISIRANSVQLDTLSLDNPSSITAATGNGGGGNIRLQVRDRIIARNGSEITAETLGRGEGGNIDLSTNQLTLTTGASLNTSTSAGGNAGLITIDADSVNLETNSQILSEAETNASGNAGSIDIQGELLTLSNSSNISSSTDGSGSAGNIRITTNSTTVDRSSQILSEAQTNATGSGGNLNLTTNTLTVGNGGALSTSTAGAGNAGNTDVSASTVTIDGTSNNNPSGIFSEVRSQASGQGGRINLNANTLNLSDSGIISTNTAGEGNAGSLNITANTATLNRGGQISSGATTGSSGNGGNVNFAVNNTLRLTSEGQVSTSSEGLGQAGNIQVSADRILMDQGNITATSVETGGGNLEITTNFLGTNNNSLISTSVSDSTGGGGDLTINSDFIVAQDNSDIRANAVFGPGGNIRIFTLGIFLGSESEISASSQFGTDGIVDISNPDVDRKVGTVQLPEQVTDVSQLIATGCSSPQQNALVVTGRGGLPQDPRQTLTGETVWSDLRSDLRQSRSTANQNPATQNAGASTAATTQTIIEAQAWVVNQRGNLELVAALPNQVNSQSPWFQPVQCPVSSTQ